MTSHLQKVDNENAGNKYEVINVIRRCLRSAAGFNIGFLSRSAVWLTLVFCFTFGSNDATAQETVTFKAADTSSPRDTLRSFINACNEIHNLIEKTKYFDRNDPLHMAIADRILDCLDDSELPAFAREERAGEIAACLKEILDRVDLPPWEKIPDVDEIISAGGFEKLTHYRIPDTRITISRVEKGPRRHEYLFSAGTVERAKRYFKRIESKPYRTEGPQVSEDFYQWYVSAPGNPTLATIVDHFPDILRRGRTLGLANWKWPGLIVTIIVAIVLMTVVYRAHARITNRAYEKSLFAYWLTIGFPIVAVLIPVSFNHLAYHYLTLRALPLYITDFTCVLISMLAGLWLIFAASNRLAASVIASPFINPEGLNAQLVQIVSKMASIVFTAILFLVGGQYLGIPIATLLASAGIGGVALALGAQDTLKTLFGTLNLLSDQPCRVGDRIIFEKYDGVVEDIGLRSVRVRLLNGNQVTIPNDQLAGNDIENVGRREYIRRDGMINIPLDTRYEKVEMALEILREYLDDHEGMDPDHPPRVFFDDFSLDAFTIKFIYWYSPPEYWKFKAFGEKFNLNIFRKFEAQGIQFSLPIRHSFWKKDDVQGPIDVNLLSDSEKK